MSYNKVTIYSGTNGVPTFNWGCFYKRKLWNCKPQDDKTYVVIQHMTIILWFREAAIKKVAAEEMSLLIISWDGDFYDW